jgi:hypothetical protein
MGRIKELSDRSCPRLSVFICGLIKTHELFTIYDLRFTMLVMPIPFVEENDQTRAREQHLEALRKLVGNVYPNKFERSEVAEAGREDTIAAIVEKFRAFEPTTR